MAASQKQGTALHYPFTKPRPRNIVKTDADSSAFHVSVRIPAPLRNRLKKEAKLRHVTLNSLIISILAKYDSFDKILEGTKAIPLSGAFFEELLEITSIEQMENIAKKLGAKVVRQSFAFQGIDFNLDNLIKFYFEPLSEHSGWYQFNTRFEGASRKLVFTHTHGPKWTAFLKQYYAAIIYSATGSEPEVTLEDEVLTFTCR
jgi:hypothetical protein